VATILPGEDSKYLEFIGEARARDDVRREKLMLSLVESSPESCRRL